MIPSTPNSLLFPLWLRQPANRIGAFAQPSRRQSTSRSSCRPSSKNHTHCLTRVLIYDLITTSLVKQSLAEREEQLCMEDRQPLPSVLYNINSSCTNGRGSISRGPSTERKRVHQLLFAINLSLGTDSPRRHPMRHLFFAP